MPEVKEGQKISEVASVAPEKGTVRRAIQMKMFLAAADQKDRVAYTKKPETLGAIVGGIAAVRHRPIEGKDGKVDDQILAEGEFEAVNYATGETFESGTAYLPRYFLEPVEAILKQPDVRGLDVGLEIVLVATGKAIPVAYEVRSLSARPADSPIERVKRNLLKAKRLKGLPQPQEVPGEVAALADLRPEGEEIAEKAPAEAPEGVRAVKRA